MKNKVTEAELLTLVRLATLQDDNLGDKIIEKVLEAKAEKSRHTLSRVHLLEKLVIAENPKEFYELNKEELDSLRLPLSSVLRPDLEVKVDVDSI